MRQESIRLATLNFPEGSILGPLLFLLYINNLSDALSPATMCAIFVDYTNIYREIKTWADALSLQQDVGNIAKCGNMWDLKFNATKCVSLSICPTERKINYQYTLNLSELEGRISETEIYENIC